MLPKPRAIVGVGVVQTFLAAAFVIWLLFFPDTATNFAWPIQPRLSAMFIGAGFILRVFLGYHLWRETLWYRLRWIVWGNFAFLGVIFLATFWHVDKMNFHSNIWVAHVWLFAYIIEPLILPFIEPHGAAADAPVPPELQHGPLSEGLKATLFGVVVVGATVAGLMIINPAFLSSRWPWPLDPFDARIMAAWPAGCAVWAGTLYFCHDWSEAKVGVQGLILFCVAQFAVWVVTVSQYDPTRHNRWSVGVILGLAALLLIFFYWRQERTRPARQPAEA